MPAANVLNSDSDSDSDSGEALDAGLAKADAVRVNAVAVRWRRYGKDRLYVTGEDGTRLGYYDLLAGHSHIEVSSRVSEFDRAVTAWHGDRDVTDVAPARDTPARVDPPLQEEAATVPAQDEAGRPAIAGPATRIETASAPDEQTEPAWEDLAERRAGAMARKQALALKQAAPARTLVARVLRVHTDERARRIGADGEEKVAGQLAKLAKKDPRWHYLHAVPVGKNGSDIDHLVVGPGGVFSLNAKHHPRGKVWVAGDALVINGQRQPYLRNSRHEAARAAKLLTAACRLPVAVIGVVVPVGADKVTVKTPPDDVHVVNRMALVRWLRRRPEQLTEAQVDIIFDTARRSTTWQPT